MPEPVPLPTPDFAEAERFLTALDDGAEWFTFQTFDDVKGRADGPPALVISGPLARYQHDLARLNAAGAGVFVTVNATDGKGRKLENIQRLRAVWHEDDTGAARDFPLEPHIVVESSPGKYHRYWLAEGMSQQQFRGVMETLVREHGSDPNAKDAARVLRLPGFFHQKNPERPFQVRLVAVSGAQPYGLDELLGAFPPGAPPPAREPGEEGRTLDPAKLREIQSALAYIDATAREDWLTVGMALHATGAREAFGLWADWAQSTGGGNYDPAGQRKTWDSFGKRSGKLVTLASLFKLAKAGGWVKPQPPRATAEVTDISAENAARLYYEERIQEAEGETGELLLSITPDILKDTLREATKESLLKKISEVTGVSVRTLKSDAPRLPAKPPSLPGGELPEAVLKELNERHAVVPVGGKTLILNREYDPSLRRPLLTFSARADFITRYENRTVLKGREELDIGTYWLKDPGRRQTEGLVFYPGGEVEGYFNLWTGWGVKPKPGCCDRFIEFTREVICGGDSARFAYVWGWMAHLFQRPTELPGTALVLRGAQGIGKNRFAEALGRLVGAHFLQLNMISQVTGRFSGHLADALLVFANEAIWGGDKTAEGALKAMITDPYSAIEAKGKDIRTCANFKRLIAASNEEWIVPRGKGDRRFVILDVADTHKEDRGYFNALHHELRTGGYRALMHELMTAPLEAFHPSQIPESVRVCGWDLALRSASSIERWWYDVLQRGYLYMGETQYGDYDSNLDSGYLWPDQLPSEQVQKQYLGWCEKHRIHHPESIETLGSALNRFGLKKLRPRCGGRRVWAYGFPDLGAGREIFGAQFGVPLGTWEEYDD